MYCSWKEFSYGNDGQGMTCLSFSEKNGMQNVKAVSLNKNTPTLQEIERENNSFFLPNTECMLYSICLILK